MDNGERIREARQRAGLTQEELGAQVGVSMRTIGNWERGTTVPLNRLARLREVLDGYWKEQQGGQESALTQATDVELLAEIARRFARTRERRNDDSSPSPATEQGTPSETSKATGTYIDPTAGRITIGDLGPAWLSRQGHLKATTRRDLAGAWNNHVQPHWGNTRINDIKRSHVVEWAGSLGKSRTTTSRAVGVLHGILDDAVKDRLIATNPARNIPMPRKNQKDRYYLTHEQVAMMAENSHGRDTLIYTACYLGLRWGELTGLRVMDIGFTRRRLTVAQTIHKNGSKVEVSTPKNHERRSVPIPRFIATLLAEQCDRKQSDGLVFTNQQGSILSRPHMDRGWWPSMLTTAGVPAWFTPHDMRHAAASLAISSGANVKAVQRMLGHKSAAMTLDTYADLFDSDLDAVADALDAAQNFYGQNVGANGS